MNFRGTTVPCSEYTTSSRVFVDTPGLHRASDADTVRRTLEALEDADEVLLVASATQLDEDLDLLLPLVQGRRASIAVTRWDLVADHASAREAIVRMSLATGLPFVVLDARRPECCGARGIAGRRRRPAQSAMSERRCERGGGSSRGADSSITLSQVPR